MDSVEQQTYVQEGRLLRRSLYEPIKGCHCPLCCKLLAHITERRLLGATIPKKLLPLDPYFHQQQLQRKEEQNHE